MARDVFETSNTVQFTFVSSVAPDAAPSMAIYGLGGTIVDSITATQSDTTHYYALYTMPTSQGTYLGEWKAIKTMASSARNFYARFLFNVSLTSQ